MFKYPCQAKISKFYILLSIKEDVSRFQITMENRTATIISTMTLFQRQRKLSHDTQNERLLQISPVRKQYTTKCRTEKCFSVILNIWCEHV